MRAAGRGRANGTALYTIMTSTPLSRSARRQLGVFIYLHDGVYGSTEYYVRYEFTKSRGAIHFYSILFSLHEAYVRENID